MMGKSSILPDAECILGSTELAEVRAEQHLSKRFSSSWFIAS